MPPELKLTREELRFLASVLWEEKEAHDAYPISPLFQSITNKVDELLEDVDG